MNHKFRLIPRPCTSIDRLLATISWAYRSLPVLPAQEHAHAVNIRSDTDIWCAHWFLHCERGVDMVRTNRFWNCWPDDSAWSNVHVEEKICGLFARKSITCHLNTWRKFGEIGWHSLRPSLHCKAVRIYKSPKLASLTPENKWYMKGHMG